MKILLLLLALALNAAASAAETPERVIIMADRSESLARSNPPETSLAVIQHFINLAALADRNIEVCVITFGNEVRVFGDKNGKPTSAFETLLKRLETEWPEPHGGTPLDEAFDKAAMLCREAPGQTTVLLLSDGQPDSGRLQPNRFSKIRQLIDTQRELVVNRHVEDGMPILTEMLRRFDLAIENPNSELFQKLYETQVEAETELVLKFAAEMNRPAVRFVTVDFAGLQVLEKIHKTAGGSENDLIRTEPNRLFSSLNEVFLFAGLVQIKPLALKANDTVCETQFQVTTDAMAEAVYVAVEFQPAIPDFASNCQLTARADGKIYNFDLQALTAGTSLGIDGVGSVATAGLKLDSVPADGQISFEWISPNGTMTVPAATVYSYLKLRDDVEADFRPSHLPAEHRAPFDVPADQQVSYLFSLSTTDDSEFFPVASAEAVLKSGSNVVRLSLMKSKERPGAVASRDVELPLGTWNVQLEVRTESGLELSLSLGQHITSTFRDRRILLRLPLAADEPSHVSNAQSHFHFGQLNDAVTERTLEFFVESHGFDFPVAVEFAANIADSEGNTPSQSWCRFQKQQLTLHPGEVEPQRITVFLPDEADEAIVDGMISGSVEIRLAESGSSIPIERVEIIADGNEIPAEQVTFELKRPRLTVDLPWACDNRIEQTRYGKEAVINIDINTGFQREVSFVVSHDGQVEKELRLLPGSSIVDRNGAVVGTMRLTSTKDSEVTQTVAPGKQARWALMFEVDAGNEIAEGQTFIDIAGEGIAPIRVPIRIVQSQPLLVGIVEWIVWSLLTGTLLYLIVAFRRHRKLARVTTDSELVLTEHRGLFDIVSVESLSPGVVALLPNVPMELASESGLSRGRGYQPGQPIRLSATEIEREPLLIRVPEQGVSQDDDEPLIFEVISVDTSEDATEIEVAILDGGRFDDQHRRCGRRLALAMTVALFLIGLGLRLDQPSVITEIQWCYDAVVR